MKKSVCELNSAEMHSMFRSDRWPLLSRNEKEAVCQEVINRYCSENGVEPAKLYLEEMNGSTYGYHSRGCIVLNENMVMKGIFTADKNGIHYEFPVLSPGYNTLDTLYHESTHYLQEKENRASFTYMKPETDHDLYRIQANEKEAYDTAMKRTMNAINEVEEKYGFDPSKYEYYAAIDADSFDKALSSAQKNYGCIQIEKTLNKCISDRDHGIIGDENSFDYKHVDAMFELQETRDRNRMLESLISGNRHKEEAYSNNLQIDRSQSL